MNNQSHPYQAQLQSLRTEIEQNKKLLADPEFRELAQEEIAQLEKQEASLVEASKQLQQSVHEQKETAQNPTIKANAIIELRAGTGGDEAKIWAEDLLRMYLRYCENKGLKAEFVDDLIIKISNQTQLEITQIDPETQEATVITNSFFPYQLFKQEAGVHRVQRVPTTEAQGRIHTSTASVAVLPELKKHDITVRTEDLTWEFMRSGGAGGQSVNKTSSAVRLIHKPSGIMVRVSQERKQLQNREIALELLRAQLWERQEEARLATLDEARNVIGHNLRAEKIRTYNYPQNRVTDHRINQSWHQLDSIIEGNLDLVISSVKQKLSENHQSSYQD
jgi:peptide chain release factor 1